MIAGTRGVRVAEPLAARMKRLLRVTEDPFGQVPWPAGAAPAVGERKVPAKAKRRSEKRSTSLTRGGAVR